jgi:S-ribosylhomocysteine lyase LuxS involved in autoinducer biosynthesis
MIKFTASTKTGAKLITFGLSDGNLQRLRQSQPILVDLEPLGVPGVQFMIMWGETEQAIVDALKAAGFNVDPEQS